MARAWIYDMGKTQQYKAAAKKAKDTGRKPPARWRVMWYDNTGEQRSQSVATKALAEDRRAEIERTLFDGTYVDPAATRVLLKEVADKCLDARHDLPKSGKRRTVPVPEFLRPELEPRLTDRSDSELLFRTRRGLPLRANNWRLREFNAAVTPPNSTSPASHPTNSATPPLPSPSPPAPTSKSSKPCSATKTPP